MLLKIALSFLFTVMVAGTGSGIAVAVADPLPAQGVFEFKGEAQPAYVLEVEVVRTLNEAGRQRMAQLQKDGFSCLRAREFTFRCSRGRIPDASAPVPSSHLELLRSRYSRLKLEFTVPVAIPVLTDENDILRAWDVQSAVTFGTQRYEMYRIWEYARFEKVILGSQWYFMRNVGERRLRLAAAVQETERRGWTEFTYDLFFE
ncbi:MAG: hypothetical protein AB7G93_22630 [Bdellovibrionales bacterium]